MWNGTFCVLNTDVILRFNQAVIFFHRHLQQFADTNTRFVRFLHLPDMKMPKMQWMETPVLAAAAAAAGAEE